MSNTLEYKGYIGTIEYSSEDRVFFGKLAMIDDLVTFEADNVDDLENNFRKSVGDYLETCKSLNKSPQKVFKGVFNVRISPELHKQAYKLALEKRVSLNKFIENSVRKYVGG